MRIANVLVLWVALAAVSLAVRPLMPVDETRYASVAWEMWSRGDWLVPHLNGVPYAEKPPLLFWLFGSGWGVFGVREWWVRLAPSLFPLGSLLVVRILARLLWPDDERASATAPWILMGAVLFALSATVTMFDGVLAFFALAALHGVATAWRGRPARGFALTGVALGLGILTKGPVVFLPVLPVCLLAPWWGGRERPARIGAWYLGCAGALVAGASIGLAWAVPATLSGGEAYGETILWRQTADRVVSSFAHGRGWWWYVPMLPLLVFPWSLWPPLWRAVAAARRSASDPGVRFCAAWLVPALILFSLISGKQPQYLLPLLPGFALLAARVVSTSLPNVGRAARVPCALVLALSGVGLLASVLVGPPGNLSDWVHEVPVWPGALLILGGALLWSAPVGSLVSEARTLASAGVLALVVLYVGVLPAARPAFDIGPVARLLHGAQEGGRPVANAGVYQGQYHFLGRLTKPIEEIAPSTIAAWCGRNPEGVVVLYSRDRVFSDTAGLFYVQAYRGRELAIHGCGDGDIPLFPQKPTLAH